MKQPASLKKCLAILMSRAVGIDQKDTARSARCADATVASVEHWARDEECGVVAALCNDKDMKNMVVNEMCFWGLDAETLVKLDRVGRDDILRLYKGEEYLLEIQQATRKGQVHTVEKAVTLQPSQSGFTDPESLTGAKYLDIPIPSNDVWINSIETTTSHPTSPYKFLFSTGSSPMISITKRMFIGRGRLVFAESNTFNRSSKITMTQMDASTFTARLNMRDIRETSS